MGRGGDAALAAPAGRRQGERCLDSKGPTQRPRPPEGGVFRATDSGMAGLQGVWAGLEQWGEGAGGGGTGGGHGAPKSWSRKCLSHLPLWCPAPCQGTGTVMAQTESWTQESTPEIECLPVLPLGKLALNLPGNKGTGFTLRNAVVNMASSWRGKGKAPEGSSSPNCPCGCIYQIS